MNLNNQAHVHNDVSYVGREYIIFHHIYTIKELTFICGKMSLNDHFSKELHYIV